MPEVTQHRTAYAMSTIRDAVRRAWPQVTRRTYTYSIESLILALVDLETRTGEAIWNNNLGNIVSTQPQSETYFVGSDQGNARKFRAYSSLDAGAVGLVKQLLSETRPMWRQGLLMGEPERYVRALGGEYGGMRYYEAPVDRYLAAYMQRWDKYRPAIVLVKAEANLPQTRRAAAAVKSASSGQSSTLVWAMVTFVAGCVGAVYALQR